MFAVDVTARHSISHHHSAEDISSSRQSVGAAGETGENELPFELRPPSFDVSFDISFDVFASFQVTEHVLQLQDYVNTMAKLQVDEQEYAYLKTIALFSPGTSILAPL